MIDRIKKSFGRGIHAGKITSQVDLNNLRTDAMQVRRRDGEGPSDFARRVTKGQWLFLPRDPTLNEFNGIMHSINQWGDRVNNDFRFNRVLQTAGAGIIETIGSWFGGGRNRRT